MRELLEIKLFVAGVGLAVEPKVVNLSVGDRFIDVKEVVNKLYMDRKVVGKKYDYIDGNCCLV